MRMGPSDSAGSQGERSRPGTKSAGDGVLSELLRRLVDAGAKNLSTEPVRQLLSEMKLPKDALLHLVTQQILMQVEETKSAIYSSVSRELRQLLERTNLADEIATALTKLSLDVTMQVRFAPRDASAPASTRVKVVTRSDVPPAPQPGNDSTKTAEPSSESAR